ncbi:MAG TPA: WXG100 family type VII secretion target, partial [Actinomycetospora sp.]|nr:WXG100 family type VII secretion target [Actinomycetospora sp.]
MVAFDAVGELAAQPGGQELSALADRVQRIDPEVLRTVGRGLGSMAEGVDGSLAALGRHGEEVRAAWGGRGAEAFTEYVGDLGRAGRTTLAATGRMRERVDGAGRVLDGLRREVDGH